MKIIIAGDFCDRYRVSEKIAREQYEDMFAEVKPIIEQADFSIVNFEFPVVKDQGNPITKCGPNLKGQPKAIEAIKYAGFNVCTLANNHILDQGGKCCLETKQMLECSEISTVGAGENLSKASEILYLHSGQETVSIINCCEHEFTVATETTPGANPINPIQQYYKIQEAKKKSDFVIVITHGGVEHYQLPTPRMKELYHFYIEAGADAVINHHQHCYSGYEVYKGKYIFYGLGNFLFDNTSFRSGIWTEGYLLELSLNSTIEYRLIPYTQCDHIPKISIMDECSLKKFFCRIYELNSIIENDNTLDEEYDKWKISRRTAYKNIFEIWNKRLTKYLFSKGLLPSLFQKMDKSVLINFIECESHRDILLSILKKENNGI